MKRGQDLAPAELIQELQIGTANHPQEFDQAGPGMVPFFSSALSHP
jgi:hypothetical protein